MEIGFAPSLIGLTQNKVMVLLGDSQEEAGFIDPSQRRYNMRSPVNWARQLTGQRFSLYQSFGVSGQRTDQIMARLSAAIATGAGILHLWCGVNDIAQNYPTASTSGATAAQNIITMAEAARLAGMTVIIEACIPASNLSATQIAQAMDLRQRILDYAERTPNVYASDAMGAVLNPTNSATATVFRAGYSLDGTHETSMGAYYHAQATLVPIITTILPPRTNLLLKNATEVPANGRWQLADNPIFITATGGTLGTGMSGTVPGGWTVTRLNNQGAATATVGTQADADGIGNNVTLACTFNAQNDRVCLTRDIVASNWQPGDIVQAVARVQVTGTPSGLTATRLMVEINGDSATTVLEDGYHATDGQGPNVPYDVVLATKPFQIPNYTAKGYIALRLFCDASGSGSANVVVKQMALRRRASL